MPMDNAALRVPDDVLREIVQRLFDEGQRVAEEERQMNLSTGERDLGSPILFKWHGKVCFRII